MADESVSKEEQEAADRRKKFYGSESLEEQLEASGVDTDPRPAANEEDNPDVQASDATNPPSQPERSNVSLNPRDRERGSKS